MATKRTKLITKICVVCGEPFQVCPPGKTSRYCSAKSDTPCCSRECSNKTRFRRGSDCNQLTPSQAAYIAGFLDGEGSVILYRRRDAVAMRVAFANTRTSPLEWIRRVTGVGNVTTKIHANKAHATAYSLLINSQAAYGLLKQVEPYLVLKQEQARLAVDFFDKLRDPKLKADRSWQYETRAQMQYLNRRGD